MSAAADLPRARWPWLVLLALLLGALTVATVDRGGPDSTAERSRSLAEQVKCPRCAGQSVADSDAIAARAIRTEITRRIGEGQTDGEIRDYLASRYGESILLTPSRSGISGLVWFLPVALFVAAVAGLAAAFRSWRVPAATDVSDEDRVLVEQALQDGR